MPDIKIFVSHRIDIDSELIDNPLYVPVRCGAVFDKENAMGIAGDNTGDNISERRMSFCEFTVQYWAWKNEQADYYGLCHYRRYLSFTPERMKTDEYGMVPVFCLDRTEAARFRLLDSGHIANEVRQYDMLLPEPAPLEGYPTPRGRVRTVRELWEAHAGILVTNADIDMMFSLIDELAPAYGASAREYFESGRHRGYNCFVMRRELFDRLCAFQFPILFALEEWLRTRPYWDELPRIPGYIGEMLFGIFTYHVAVHEQWRVKELQMVYFKNTRPLQTGWDRIKMYGRYAAHTAFRATAGLVFPLGSRRRFWAKRIWHRLKMKQQIKTEVGHQYGETVQTRS